MRAGSPLPSQLLISFKGKDGSWSEPRNLSEKLKTEGSDSMARVTPDGKYLFFQSNRSDSGVSRGLYWVDARVIEELRPAPSK
jgi:Tol biopolymer transport system component